MNTLEEVSRVIINCIKADKKVLIFGVGGNAATASNFAGELAGKYEQYEDPLPVVCINDNMSVITAITNDFGWDQVFSRQIQGLAREGDVVIGFSISGKAKYLHNAFKACKEWGTVSILLNGGTIYPSNLFTDYSVSVGHEDTPRVQEEQLRWVHELSRMVKSALVS